MDLLYSFLPAFPFWSILHLPLKLKQKKHSFMLHHFFLIMLNTPVKPAFLVIVSFPAFSFSSSCVGYCCFLSSWINAYKFWSDLILGRMIGIFLSTSSWILPKNVLWSLIVYCTKTPALQVRYLVLQNYPCISLKF